jgi:hypothetical protein
MYEAQKVLVEFGFRPVNEKFFSDGELEQTWSQLRRDFILQATLRYKTDANTCGASFKVRRLSKSRQPEYVPGVSFEMEVISDLELRRQIEGSVLQLYSLPRTSSSEVAGIL